MKRMGLLLVAAALLACLPGCTLFLSEDADILTFLLPGSIANASIDAGARTVTVTVEPMDLAGLTPTVTVSEGAELTGQPALVDGQAVTYVVKAENGDTVSWSVTVTVQYGISITYGGTKVVLPAGIIDTANAEQNALFGAGVPLAFYDTVGGYVSGYAFLTNYEEGAEGDLTYAHLLFVTGTGGAEPGTFDEASSTAELRIEPSSGEGDYAVGAGGANGGTIDMVVTVVGPAETGDVVGTFAGTGEDSDAAQVQISGFFKLKRLANDLPLA